MLVWYAQALQSSCVAACVRMALGGLGVAVTVLDPLDGPEPRHYGMAAFVSAWEVAGREALVIEAAPHSSG